MQVRNSFLFAEIKLADNFPENPKHFLKIVCFADLFSVGVFQFSFTASMGRSFPICLAGPEAASKTVKKDRIMAASTAHGENEIVSLLPVTSLVSDE